MFEKLSMRPATLNDSEAILYWRNTEQARRFSRNQTIVDSYIHQQWIEEKLSEESNSIINIFLDESLPIGMTRLDCVDCDTAEISIVVDPLFHNKGYGFKMLLLTKDLAFNKLGIKKILASVHSNNLSSIHLFNKVGFVLASKSEYFNDYELRCP